MAFGDNSAARARKAELIAEQAASLTTHTAPSGATYEIYKDLPPGRGWVLKRQGTYAVAKWYLRSREEAISRLDDHDRMVEEGRNANEHGNTPKFMRKLK